MTREDILEIIKNNIKEILDEVTDEQITPEISLKGLGANSIDRMDIIIMTLEELEIKIPLVEFAKVENISGMVDLLLKSKN